MDDQEIGVGGNSNASKHRNTEITLINAAWRDAIPDILLCHTRKGIRGRGSEEVNLDATRAGG